MTIRLLTANEQPDTSLNIIMYSTGVLTMAGGYKSPNVPNKVLQVRGEGLASASPTEYLTKYALSGVESLQSAIRGIIQDNITHTSIEQFILHWVEMPFKYLEIFEEYEIFDVRIGKRKWYQLPSRTPVTLLITQAALFTIPEVLDDEDFLVSLTNIPIKRHPLDKGFTAYTDNIIGDREVLEVDKNAK